MVCDPARRDRHAPPRPPSGRFGWPGSVTGRARAAQPFDFVGRVGLTFGPCFGPARPPAPPRVVVPPPGLPRG
eukprot:3134923-Lingulodinium_polyedra.AAC.1